MKGPSLKKNIEQGKRADNAWLKSEEKHGSREKSKRSYRCV